jgi:hypothetical protein
VSLLSYFLFLYSDVSLETRAISARNYAKATRINALYILHREVTTKPQAYTYIQPSKSHVRMAFFVYQNVLEVPTHTKFFCSAKIDYLLPYSLNAKTSYANSP